MDVVAESHARSYPFDKTGEETLWKDVLLKNVFFLNSNPEIRTSLSQVLFTDMHTHAYSSLLNGEATL